MKTFNLSFILIFIFSINTYAQKEMKDYESSYYVTFSGTHPGQVIHKGNNWDILVALKRGKTLKELKDLGIPFSQKQIEVLCALNFLEKDDETYRSLITILNKQQTIEIRDFTKDIAVKIAPLIHDDYMQLFETLKEKGFEDNTYTVLFSYIMDNIVWQMLEINNILPKKSTSVEKPIWDGTIWFYYPKRNFQCGTNSQNVDGLVFASNWSEISELSFTNLDKETILEEIIKSSKVTDNVLKETLIKYDICDNDGNLKIPYIKNDSTLNLNRYSINIAKNIYDYLTNSIDFTEISRKYNIKSKGVAIIIVYHEIMWDILDTLEEKGILKKPEAFLNPSSAKISDLKDLLLIYEE